MAQYGLTPSDVVGRHHGAELAVRGRPLRRPAEPTGEPFTYSVTTQGRLPDAEAFGNIILRSTAMRRRCG
jgi:multidrug efflux pump